MKKNQLTSHRRQHWKSARLFPFLGFILLFLSLSGCMPIKRQKETCATHIRYIPFASGGDNIWEFYDNGKRYTVFAWQPPYGITGAKYMIIYDSLRPDKHYRLESSKPVFTADEATRTTVCSIKNDVCLVPGKHGSIEYEYSVNSVSYSYATGLPDRNDTLCLKKGDQFEVEYWLENPQRAIIHLDKPM